MFNSSFFFAATAAHFHLHGGLTHSPHVVATPHQAASNFVASETARGSPHVVATPHKAVSKPVVAPQKFIAPRPVEIKQKATEKVIPSKLTATRPAASKPAEIKPAAQTKFAAKVANAPVKTHEEPKVKSEAPVKLQQAPKPVTSTVAQAEMDVARSVKCAHFKYAYVQSPEADCEHLCREMTQGSYRVVCRKEAKVVNRCHEREYNWATKQLDKIPKDPLCINDKTKIWACKTCDRYLLKDAQDYLHDDLQNGIDAGSSSMSVALPLTLLLAILF